MIGLRIAVTLGDPWDFGESRKWLPIFGEVINVDLSGDYEVALIKADELITYRGHEYRYFLGRPRYSGATLSHSHEGGEVHCNFLGISEELASADNWQKADSGWRGGGLAFIGAVKSVPS